MQWKPSYGHSSYILPMQLMSTWINEIEFCLKRTISKSNFIMNILPCSYAIPNLHLKSMGVINTSSLYHCKFEIKQRAYFWDVQYIKRRWKCRSINPQWQHLFVSPIPHYGGMVISTTWGCSMHIMIEFYSSTAIYSFHIYMTIIVLAQGIQP